jgi:hypothetical protein
MLRILNCPHLAMTVPPLYAVLPFACGVVEGPMVTQQ